MKVDIKTYESCTRVVQDIYLNEKAVDKLFFKDKYTNPNDFSFSHDIDLC